VLGVPQVAEILDRDGSDSAQPRDDFSGIVEAAHMGVASGEKSVRVRVTWILLDRKEQFWHGHIEPPSEEMGCAYGRERVADAGAGTEAQRGLDMLDCGVGLARPKPESAADFASRQRSSD
jgi:hypothetical protein